MRVGFSGLGIRVYLRHLLPSSMRSHRLCGPIDLLWDRGPIHQRLIVRELVAAHSRLRVHLFPAYAPEFNPAEFMWTQADRELANGAADDLAELRHHLDAAIRRLIADAAFDSRRTGRAECWSAKAASGKAPLVPRSGATLRPL